MARRPKSLESFYLPEIDVSKLPDHILQKITERFSSDAKLILERDDLGIFEIIQKSQHHATLFTYVLDFYAWIDEPDNYKLSEVIELVEILAKGFSKSTFLHFQRILDAPKSMRMKIDRVKRLLDLKTYYSQSYVRNPRGFGMEELSKIVSLCEDFDERLEFTHSISDENIGICTDDLWYIFRGRGVCMDSLRKLRERIEDEQLTRFDGPLRNMHKVKGVTSAERNDRKTLFFGLENVLSVEQIQEIIENRDISKEKLSRTLAIFRDRYDELEGNLESAHKSIIALSRSGKDFNGYYTWSPERKSKFHEVDLNNISKEDFLYIFTRHGNIDEIPF